MEFDVFEIIYCQDSPTGRTQVLREGLRAWQTELELAGQPDSHLLSFWVTVCQWIFLSRAHALAQA